MTGSHLERAAVIYVRQSSLAQVRDHGESTARQYGLVDEAVRLGWAASAVDVIDSDLGLSGRSADGRAGFKELMSRVCVGEVGAIFGLEVSRLARSSADLSRLLEMARLTETLVVDADGVYDLADFNDRLLLGLKGTMSEAELHLLAGRLQGAKVAAAERGELRVTLPVGYLYDDEGVCVIDPDVEVQAAIRDLFAAFRAGGSAYQVVGAFTDRRFPLRAYGGAWADELRWGQLNHSRVLGILANPAYAGTYVYGRHRSRRVIDPDGTVRTKTCEVPMAEWAVVIQDHHEGYIGWDDFFANRARLAANTTNAGARPAREGHALCQGIIGCGSCGRPMSTRYHRDGAAAYECSASRADHTTTPTCRSISAAAVDDAVTVALFDALEPEQVAVALAAADEVADRRARVTRASELALERARYEADRSERAFHACEPENRLVARSLEARWEHRLEALAEAESAHAAEQTAVVPLPSRTELEGLTGDVRALWDASTTSPRDRKRLLRSLVADITLLPEPDRTKASVGIHWHAGGSDTIALTRPHSAMTRRRTNPAAIDLARRHADLSNTKLAARLNTAGHQTGTGRPFDNKAVVSLRHYHKIPQPPVLRDGEITASEAARRLGVTPGTITNWIQRGTLTARRGLNNQWCILFDADTETACHDRVVASSHIHRPDNASPPHAEERTVPQVAAALTISTNVVYYWITHDHIHARRGPNGRWLIHFNAETEATCRDRVASSSRIQPTQTQTTRTRKKAV